MDKQEHILFLSSKDSEDICPGNDSGNFTIDLGKALQLPGHWRVQLLSFRCHLAKDQKVERKNLMVFSDICESSFVRDHYLPVLANFYYDGNSNKVRRIEEVVKHPHSVAVVPHAVQRIKIYIKDQNLQTPSFTKATSDCTEVTLRLFRK